MRALPLLVLGVLLASAPPVARADRDILALDCQGQLHLMAGTPFAMSFGMADFDDLLNHFVKMFRKRLECKCGGAMEPDEFDRKYHPFPALLNLMSETPDTSEKCITKYDMLEPGIVDLFKEVKRLVKTGNPGLLPCSHTGLRGEGCKFKIASKSGAAIDFTLAFGMKMCAGSDMTSLFITTKGAFADNLFKPCDGSCAAGLLCKNLADVGRRRSDSDAARVLGDALWSQVTAWLPPVMSGKI
jgi:hypothetical protein